MSETKGDLILLLSRENGLFWFSLDCEQSLSPIFLSRGATQQVLYGKAPPRSPTILRKLLSAFIYHTFIPITYYIPNKKVGDQASSHEFFDNLHFILKHNIYQKADFLFYELIWKTQYFLINTLNLTWFLKGLCHGLLVQCQVHVLIRYETWDITCEWQNHCFGSII